MQPPLEIAVRDIENTTAIENRIRKKVEKLARFNDRIIHCRVVVEEVQKHKHQGKLFKVSIEVDVPRKTIVANKHVNEDLYVAIRDAFAAITRQLEEFTRIKRGKTKNHPVPFTGEIVRIFSDYGFIETPDGREFYFHESFVNQPSFNELTVGTKVQFLEKTGGDGLQAHQVTAV
jgi:ribosomal subunit interface protein